MSYINPSYKPAMRYVTSITNSYPAIVTTGDVTYPGGIETIIPFINGYVSGTIIRLIIPNGFGMGLQSETQGYTLTGEITVIDDTSFSIDVDTTTLDPFVLPAPITIAGGIQLLAQNAEAIPFGDAPFGGVDFVLDTAVHNVL